MIKGVQWILIKESFCILSYHPVAFLGGKAPSTLRRPIIQPASPIVSPMRPALLNVGSVMQCELAVSSLPPTRRPSHVGSDSSRVQPRIPKIHPA